VTQQGGLPFMGWFVKTLEEEGSQGRDAREFVVEAKWDDDNEWSEVAMPKWLSITTGADVAFYAGKRVSLPERRGKVVVFQTTASRAWFLHRVLRSLICCVLLTLVSMVAAAGRGHEARWLAKFTMAFSLAIQCVSGVCFALEGSILAMIECFLWIPTYLTVVLALFWEKRFLHFLLLSVVADVAAVSVQACLVDGEYTASFFRNNVPVQGCVLFCLMLWVKVSRWHALQKSRKLVEKDQKQYERVWTMHVGCDREEATLRLLENKVASINLRGHVCRQHERKRFNEITSVSHGWTTQTPDFLLDSLGFRTVPNTIDLSRPVTSLDQLYACASVVNAIVLDKLKTWALQSDGMFPLESASGVQTELEFRRWSDVEGTQDEELVKWSCLKKYHRATEKVTRSYGYDTSRLLDVCRHAIIFETIKDLSRCLDVIVGDTDVSIERIKNRFSRAYDPDESAGYRDFSINLRLVTPETIALGVEAHVCEVQLILKSFANIKTLNGHKRYIAWRNWRGL